MPLMKRKQIYIELHQERQLKALSRRRGVTESELIREGIDRVLKGPVWFPSDHQTWERELKFMAAPLERGPRPYPEIKVITSHQGVRNAQRW